MSDDRHTIVADAVAGMLRDLVSRFAHATVEGPVPRPPAGREFALGCSDPGTARVLVYPTGDDINVYVGEDTWIELYSVRRNPSRELEQLREILEAIVGGRFEETVWTHGGRKVKSRAVLRRSDGRALMRPHGYHGIASIAADPRSRRISVRYEPYS